LEPFCLLMYPIFFLWYAFFSKCIPHWSCLLAPFSFSSWFGYSFSFSFSFWSCSRRPCALSSRQDFSKIRELLCQVKWYMVRKDFNLYNFSYFFATFCVCFFPRPPSKPHPCLPLFVALFPQCWYWVQLEDGMELVSWMLYAVSWILEPELNFPPSSRLFGVCCVLDKNANLRV